MRGTGFMRIAQGWCDIREPDSSPMDELLYGCRAASWLHSEGLNWSRFPTLQCSSFFRDWRAIQVNPHGRKICSSWASGLRDGLASLCSIGAHGFPRKLTLLPAESLDWARMFIVWMSLESSFILSLDEALGTFPRTRQWARMRLPKCSRLEAKGAVREGLPAQCWVNQWTSLALASV